MDQYALPIVGFHDLLVPNTFTRQDESAHLAILWPGYRYRATMPLLYYAEWLLLARGADVLRVETAYDAELRFETADAAERASWFREDVAAVYKAAVGQRDYARITLVGKSIGTRAMGQLLATVPRLKRADCIWLTPLLEDATLRGQIVAAKPRSLFVAGSADRHHDAEGMAEVVSATGGVCMRVPGADHSLEIVEDLPASLAVLAQVVTAMGRFLRGAEAGS